MAILFFAAGAIVYLAFFAAAWWLWNEESATFGVVVGGLNLTLGTALMLGLYGELFTDHPAYILDKREWTCAASHREPVTTYDRSGNVMVPITSYQRVCDSYGRLP